MEKGRVTISYKSLFLGIMLVMGMMVEPSDANYQQCFLKCIKLCGYNIFCTVACEGNCFLTDPPGTVVAGSNTNINNLKFCNMGCVAAALTAHNPSAMSDGEAKRMTKKVVNCCSSSCSKNFQVQPAE